MSETPTRNNAGSSHVTTPPSSITLLGNVLPPKIDRSTRTAGNILPVPNIEEIPRDFWACCDNPTKLVLAPDHYKYGFWILTCHNNNFEPQGKISLQCPSFMILQPNVAQKSCSFCKAEAELLQTHGTDNIGHWYWKCPNRDKEQEEVLKKKHHFRLVTTDAQEAKEIKKSQKQILPVSHIFKNGNFIFVQNYTSLHETRPPINTWNAVNKIPDDAQVLVNQTPTTIASQRSSRYPSPMPQTPFLENDRLLEPPSIVNTPTTIKTKTPNQLVTIDSEDETYIKVEDPERGTQNPLLRKVNDVKGKESAQLPRSPSPVMKLRSRTVKKSSQLAQVQQLKKTKKTQMTKLFNKNSKEIKDFVTSIEKEGSDLVEISRINAQVTTQAMEDIRGISNEAFESINNVHSQFFDSFNNIDISED
jgi:hypothetical protein